MRAVDTPDGKVIVNLPLVGYATVYSEKTDEFFSLVEQVSPGPRLEMFARRERPGWNVWGDEVDGVEVGRSAR